MATKKEEAAAAQAQAGAGQTKVRWDTSHLSSAYANVCAVNSTREEVVLNFGINKAWERAANEMQIELTSRIILSPFAAQRLHTMLGQLLTEYENRYGKLQQSAQTADAPTTKQ
jgi:hypothetical protein